MIFQGNDQRIPKISAHVGVTLALQILLTGNYKINSSAANFRCGSTTDSNDPLLPRPVLGDKQTSTARNRTLASECPNLGDKQTWGGGGWNVRV